MPSSIFTAVASLSLLGFAAAQNSSSLPIIDLGYELYQASYFNVRLVPGIAVTPAQPAVEHVWNTF